MGDHTLALCLLAGVLLFWCAGMAYTVGQSRLPASESGTVVVVFPPSYDGNDALSAIIRADGLLVRESWFENVWVVHGAQPGFVGKLTEAGAWGAFHAGTFRPVIVQGCFL